MSQTDDLPARCHAAHVCDCQEAGQPCQIAQRGTEMQSMLTTDDLPGRISDHIEQRLLTWKQRHMNRSGDRLALDDFMGDDAVSDLVDYVCDEYALDALLQATAARAPLLARIAELEAKAARPDPDKVLRLFSEYRSMMAKAVFEATQGNDITAGSLEIAADDAASELVKLLKGGE